MTKKAYPEASRVSRPNQPAQKRDRLPQAYRALNPVTGEHPVDVAIDQMRDVRAARRDLRRCSDRLRDLVQDISAFVAFEDAWSNYCILRNQRYFDFGYAHGLLVGRAESLAASADRDPNARAFAHQICHAAAMSDLSQERLAATMLEVARAIVLGLPMP